MDTLYKTLLVLNFCLNIDLYFIKKQVTFWLKVSISSISALVPVSFLNSLRPRQNGRRFADVFKSIFLNENVWILLNISLKFVPKVWINNIPAFVQIMAWHRSGDKPLSEPTMASLLTHICVPLPQWVKCLKQRSDLSRHGKTAVYILINGIQLVILFHKYLD